MTDKARWITFSLAAISIAAGITILVLTRGGGVPDSGRAPAPPPASLDSKTAAAPAKSTPATEVEDTPGPHNESASPAAFPPAAERRERVGRGRVFGTAKIPVEAGRGAEISIALHGVPSSKDADFTYDDTLVSEVKAAADGSFEFRTLQFGRYVLLATATGYTINGSATLSAERPEYETTLNLVPGANISGRVVDQNHEPVPGARVFVAAWDIQGEKSNAPRDRALASQRRSDEKGGFTITNLRKSLNTEPGYRLAVKAEGYATFLSDYLQAGAQGVELMLKPGGIVSGMLLNAATGEPVPDKTIAIDSELAMENLTARTDAEGFFFVPDVPPGTQTASLRDDELVITPESAKFQVAAEGPTEEVVLQAAAGGKISGRVYNAETGEGVAGVAMSANFEGGTDSRPREAKTGDGGAYTLKGLKAGSYRVRYEKPNGYPQNYRGDETTPLVSATIGGETGGVDFALSQGLLISGRVVDEEGKPVAQASVNANARQGNVSDYAQTKDDGSFVLAGFSVGQLVQFSVRKQGYALVGAEPARGLVTVEEDGASGVRLVLGAAASISGTVVDSAGQPKGLVDVRAQPTSGVDGQISTANADGTIKIGQLSPGEYYFIFPRDGRWSDPGPGRSRQKVKVAKGEALTGVRILYTDPSGEGKLSIAGRVTDTKGSGIARATVRVQGPWREVTADATGNYTITGLTEGSYTLTVASYAHSGTASKSAEAGATGINFVLKSLATVEGRVVSAQTSQPITAFRVRAAGQTGQRYFVRDEFVSVRDADGRFTLTSVEDGATALEVRAEDFADTTLALSGIVGGETRKDVLVRMEIGVVVAGRVVDSSGKGIGGARIFLGNPPDEYAQDRMQRASSGSDGGFRLTSMPAGQVQISAAHPEYASRTVTASLVARVENTVEIVLSAGASVEGRVTVNGKTAASNAHVYASFGNSNRQTQADADGRYRLAGLPDGTVHVQASLRDGGSNRSQSRSVEIADGYVAELNFDFTQGTATIEGTVYKAEGVPLGGQGHLSATSQTATGATENYNTQLGADGSYLLEGVAAGIVELRVFGQEGGAKISRVNVAAGARVHKDILLYGGGSLRAEVSGGEDQTMVLLLTGPVQIAEFNMQFYMSVQNQLAGQAQVRDGQATISGLEAGIYTALIYSIVAGAEQSGDPLAGAKWTTQEVEIKEDQEVSIQVRL